MAPIIKKTKIKKVKPHKDLTTKELAALYNVTEHVHIELGKDNKPVGRPVRIFTVTPKSKKSEKINIPEAIKLVNSKLHRKNDIFDGRYAKMQVVGRGRNKKTFFLTKDIHMDEVDSIIIFFKKDLRRIAKLHMIEETHI